MNHEMRGRGYRTRRTRAPRGRRLIAQFAPEVAERWFNGFVKALLTLEQLPRRYGRAGEQKRFPCELRQLLYGRRRSHRAVFTVRENKVVVLSIRHAAQKVLQPSDFLSDDLA